MGVFFFALKCSRTDTLVPIFDKLSDCLNLICSRQIQLIRIFKAGLVFAFIKTGGFYESKLQ